MPTEPNIELSTALTSLAKVMAASDKEHSVDDASIDTSAETAGPAFISIAEAASILGLSRASTCRYAAAGYPPVKRLGRRVYVIRARLADVTRPDQQQLDAA